MNENTMTFTARSREKPEKMATFTLQNGNVTLQLGDALLASVEQVFDTLSDDEAVSLRSWLKPITTGSMEHLAEPIPVQDFDANLEEDSFQTVAWLRAGGLRLAPVMLNWQHVDNPDGAKAFVEELQERQQKANKLQKLPSIFDYWITWVIATILLVVMPVVFIRRRQRPAEA